MGKSREANLEATRRWRERHRDEWNEYQRQYYRFRRTKMRRAARERYAADPERVLAKQREKRRLAAHLRSAEEQQIMREMEAIEADALRTFLGTELRDVRVPDGLAKRISEGQRARWARKRAGLA